MPWNYPARVSRRVCGNVEDGGRVSDQAVYEWGSEGGRAANAGSALDDLRLRHGESEQLECEAEDGMDSFDADVETTIGSGERLEGDD